MKCKYPNCKHKATKSWALVSVCDIHYDMIKKDMIDYYKRRIMQSERGAYNKIKHLTPWG